MPETPALWGMAADVPAPTVRDPAIAAAGTGGPALAEAVPGAASPASSPTSAAESAGVAAAPPDIAARRLSSVVAGLGGEVCADASGCGVSTAVPDQAALSVPVDGASAADSRVDVSAAAVFCTAASAFRDPFVGLLGAVGFVVAGR